MLLQPCKGCTERHPGCHSDCSKYEEMRAQRDEIRRKHWIAQDLLSCEIELQHNMQGGKSKRQRKHKGAY